VKDMAQLLPRLRIDPATDTRLIKRLVLAAETLPKVRAHSPAAAPLAGADR